MWLTKEKRGVVISYSSFFIQSLNAYCIYRIRISSIINLLELSVWNSHFTNRVSGTTVYCFPKGMKLPSIQIKTWVGSISWTGLSRAILISKNIAFAEINNLVLIVLNFNLMPPLFYRFSASPAFVATKKSFRFLFLYYNGRIHDCGTGWTDEFQEQPVSYRLYWTRDVRSRTRQGVLRRRSREQSRRNSEQPRYRWCRAAAGSE